MAQSVRLTNDQGERLAAKSRLLEKIEQATQAKSQGLPARQVFLIPEGYEEYAEGELFSILKSTPALHHSQESAIQTIEILYGRTPKPDHVEFQTVAFKGISFARRRRVEEVKSSLLNEIEVVNVFVTNDFSSMKPGEKKWYLTTEGKLSPDKANDYLASLDGKPTTGKYKFNTSIINVERPESTVKEPEPLVVPIEDLAVVVVVPENHLELSEKDLHFALTHDSKFSCSNEKAVDALNYLYGRPTFKSIVVITESGERLEPYPGERVIEEPKEETLSVVILQVPSAFSQYRPFDKYQYLQTVKSLTPDEAHAALEGQVYDNRTFIFEYEESEIESSNPVEEYLEIRDDIKSKLSERIAASIREPKAKPERVISVPEQVELSVVTIQVPAAFNQYKPKVKFQFLQTVKNLTPDEAHAALEGKPFNNQSFVFEYSEAEPETFNPVEDYLSDREAIKAELAKRIESSIREPKAKPEVQVPVVQARVQKSVILPVFAKELSAKDLYLYLVSEKWLPEEANEFVAFMNGSPVQVDFEVTFKE